MRKELELRLQGEFPFMRTDYPCMPYDFISATDRLGTISKEIIGGHRYNTHGFGGRWYNTYGFCGCDCGDGWYKIIHGLCSDIADAYARQGREVDIVPRYVEEQSGMLWFDYIFGGAGEPPPDTDTSDDGGGVASSADKSGMEDIVGEIVEKWERASESTCQLCGAPAPSVVREKHQWSPLCDACLEKGMQMPEPAWSWSLDEATGALTVSGVGCMFTAEPGNHYLYTGVDCHGAFRDRTHLIKSVVIEDGITAIGCRAFEGCFRLESVSIPDSVTYIGAAAFGDCDALKSVRIPDGVRIICGHAFSGCDSLSDVHIPDGVVAIGNGAFSRCPALTDVRIPEGVRYVGVGAFKGCASLARVTIPATVESIGAGLFKGCHSLKNVGIAKATLGLLIGTARCSTKQGASCFATWATSTATLMQSKTASWKSVTTLSMGIETSKA
jgi:hypothetical protein